MDAKLSDSELRVMNLLWRAGGELPAREVIEKLGLEDGMSSSAAYTLVYRCIKKGAIERLEPGFVCRAVPSRRDVQEAQTNELVDRLFDGSVDKLFASLLQSERVSRDEIDRLRAYVEHYDDGGRTQTL
ncbi:BlaI/MecI/CopY family transcriptional regulator [bacterium]|nr:BlaI/MecI/CopY family transcriptional regulator [bacterium]